MNDFPSLRVVISRFLKSSKRQWFNEQSEITSFRNHRKALHTNEVYSVNEYWRRRHKNVVFAPAAPKNPFIKWKLRSQVPFVNLKSFTKIVLGVGNTKKIAPAALAFVNNSLIKPFAKPLFFLPSLRISSKSQVSLSSGGHPPTPRGGSVRSSLSQVFLTKVGLWINSSRTNYKLP